MSSTDRKAASLQTRLVAAGDNPLGRLEALRCGIRSAAKDAFAANPTQAAALVEQGNTALAHVVSGLYQLTTAHPTTRSNR